MNPSFDVFANSLNKSKFRLLRYSEQILFCGGQRNSDLNATAERYSARDFIVERLSYNNHEINDRILFAEDVTDWFKEKHFVDLLSFERHISEIASLVFLIPESDGSFTELGAFATDSTINKKLFVLNNENVDNESSFISLGPIELLVKQSEHSVTYYPWSKSNVNNDLADIWRDVIADLMEFEKSLVKGPRFSEKLDGHVSLLIADIILIFIALKENEIISILDIILNKPNNLYIRKHLFILEKLNIIQRKKRAHDVYFTANFDDAFIKYGFVSKTDQNIKDRSLISFEAASWFHEHDKIRSIVIKNLIEARNE